MLDIKFMMSVGKDGRFVSFIVLFFFRLLIKFVFFRYLWNVNVNCGKVEENELVEK